MSNNNILHQEGEGGDIHPANDPTRSHNRHEVVNRSESLPSERSATRATSPSVTSTDHTSSVTFVDYRQPPSIRVLPPAKYKLWMIVFVLVYLAIWCSEIAGLFEFLRFHGWLSPDGAQFLGLCIIVLVMTYGALDLFVAVFTFAWGGEKYGLGPWLLAGRTEWIHHAGFSDSFLAECLKFAIQILEDGFGMFNTSPSPGHAPPGPSSGSLKKPKFPIRKEQKSTVTGDPLGRNNDGDSDEIDDDDGTYSYATHQKHNDDADEEVYCACSSDTCPAILKIEHHLNPDRSHDYEKWHKRVDRAVRLFPGFLDAKFLDSVSEELVLDSMDQYDVETGTHISGSTHPLPTSGRPPRKHHRITNSSEAIDATNHTVKSNLYTVYVKFGNVDSLNDWMLSPRRNSLSRIGSSRTGQP
jgi:antibiotic biosynthesis monooxygenase (ABM) superfamily enzyme